MPDRLIWHGAWKGEMQVKTIFTCILKTSRLYACALWHVTIFTFLFLLMSLVELHPWSLRLWHSWSLSAFLQAQCLWHQVLLFMASQPQDQAVHKTWVSFQGHSDAFIHFYYVHRKRRLYSCQYCIWLESSSFVWFWGSELKCQHSCEPNNFMTRSGNMY